jgi:heterodisulfide reductase subunit A
MKRVGVFVCHCGVNIAGTVDVKRVVEAVSALPEVAYAADYQYMCSEPGQGLLTEAIDDEALDAVIVAACSPTMHETTFRKATQRGGLNQYHCEIANIREQDSWVHQDDPEAATQKAVDIIRSMLAKVSLNEALVPLTLPVVKRVLVIGGGIAGMVAALDIADAGYPVLLVERESTLGGNVARLSGLYLDLDPAVDLTNERVAAVVAHPNIEVLTETVVDSVGGYVGNFTVTLQSACADSAPAGARAEANDGDPVDVGAVILATGYDLYDKGLLTEYGGSRCPDVVDGLEFERMLRPDGPTGGRILKPSDGEVPREVVWVQCAGSRDPELHKAYCSKVCCMYVAKQTMLYKQQVPDGQAYVFYIDIRSQGRGYEEFVQRAMEEYDVLYLRGKVSRVFEEDGKTVVWGADTLSDRQVEIAADLVVLATATVPARGATDVARRLRVATDEHGFFSEAHPKLRPVESLTAGVFLAGAAQFPKDIPETVAQASGAAAKVLSMFAQREMVREPTVAQVDEEICSGCGLCIPACPYDARAMHDWRPLATVNGALCQGCGACAVVCPNKASRVRNFTARQVLAMVEELL